MATAELVPIIQHYYYCVLMRYYVYQDCVYSKNDKLLPYNAVALPYVLLVFICFVFGRELRHLLTRELGIVMRGEEMRRLMDAFDTNEVQQYRHERVNKKSVPDSATFADFFFLYSLTTTEFCLACFRRSCPLDVAVCVTFVQPWCCGGGRGCSVDFRPLSSCCGTVGSTPLPPFSALGHAKQTTCIINQTQRRLSAPA